MHWLFSLPSEGGGWRRNTDYDAILKLRPDAQTNTEPTVGIKHINLGKNHIHIGIKCIRFGIKHIHFSTKLNSLLQN